MMIEVTSKTTDTIYEIFKAMRISHWIKNIIIFIPLASLTLLTEFHNNLISNLFLYLVTFISISLLSSACYMINDIMDVESDRKHPIKRQRPLASRSINIFQYKYISGLLFTLALIISLYSLAIFTYIIAYLILFSFYNLLAKKILHIDVATLSLFYTLRLILGFHLIGASIDIDLLLVLYSITFAIGSIKRQTEYEIFTSFRFVDFTAYFYKGYYLLTSIVLSIIPLILALSSKTNNSLRMFDEETLISSIVNITITIYLLLSIYKSKLKNDDVAKEIFNRRHIIIPLTILMTSLANS